MAINGMMVAAAFNGGGVSSLAYDAINVEEVSVRRLRRPRRDRHRRPGDEHRAAHGRQHASRARRSATPPATGRAATTSTTPAQPADADHARPRHHRRLRLQSLVRRADQAGQAVVLGQLSQVLDRAGRRRHLRQQVRARPGALGLSGGYEHRRRATSRAATSRAASRHRSRRRTASCSPTSISCGARARR